MKKSIGLKMQNLSDWKYGICQNEVVKSVGLEYNTISLTVSCQEDKMK